MIGSDSLWRHASWRMHIPARPRSPKADKHRAAYNAACAAALAARGQGVDDPRPDDTAKITLRSQALARLEQSTFGRVCSEPLVRTSGNTSPKPNFLKRNREAGGHCGHELSNCG